jgi:hypothetical protein
MGGRFTHKVNWRERHNRLSDLTDSRAVRGKARYPATDAVARIDRSLWRKVAVIAPQIEKT